MNDLQRQAAEAPDGYVQIIAGPGTGKTVTIVGRVVELLNRGVHPRRIVALTFTRAAAREIKQRVAQKLGGDCAIVVGTFHSIAYRFLRRFGGCEYSNLSVIDDTEKRHILQMIVDDKSQVKELARQISRIQVFGEAIQDVDVRQVYSEYIQLAQRCNRADYDGLLVLFKDFLETRKSIQDFVGAVLVDEFQDTSRIQLDIALLMASRCHNLTVVGDPDQSIYAFRNAEPRNFELMLAMIPKDHTYVRFLEQNYRSEQPILDAAYRVITKRAKKLGPKRRLTAIAPSAHSSSSIVRFVKFQSQEEEATGVAKHISLLLSSGVKPCEICVLSRQSRDYKPLETQLVSRSIKVRMVGGQKVLARPEVRAIIDYIRVALNNSDQLAIMRTINSPPRKLGPVTLQKVSSGSSKLPDMSKIRSQPATSNFSSYTEVVDKLTSILGSTQGAAETKAAITYLTSELYEEITELTEAVDQFATFLEDESDDEDERSFSEKFVSLWALQSNKDETKESSTESSVTLSTIHSAKGLEWPVVFVVGAGRSDMRPEGISEDLESEETRLLYVALTRAKSYLVVTSPCLKFDDRLALSDKMETDFELPDEFDHAGLSRSLGRAIQPSTKASKKEHTKPTYLGKPIDLAEGFILASELPMTAEPALARPPPTINPKKRKKATTEYAYAKTHEPAQRDKSRAAAALRPTQPSLLKFFGAAPKKN